MMYQNTHHRMMPTTTNVFVYHPQDHEGRLVADVIRALYNQPEPFRFLPIESPGSLQRLRLFLQQHGLAIGAPVILPFVVIRLLF